MNIATAFIQEISLSSLVRSLALGSQLPESPSRGLQGYSSSFTSAREQQDTICPMPIRDRSMQCRIKARRWAAFRTICSQYQAIRLRVKALYGFIRGCVRHARLVPLFNRGNIGPNTRMLVEFVQNFAL